VEKNVETFHGTSLQRLGVGFLYITQPRTAITSIVNAKLLKC